MTSAQLKESNIIQSITGRHWRLRCEDERTSIAIAQKLSVAEILGRVLAGRGVDAESAEKFLNPTLRDSMPDPSHLMDMDIAAARMVKAITGGESIAVFGDYDVDGATSSALLKRYLDALGARSIIYIPDRVKEGYGPNTAALIKLKEQGASVVITVDCGTVAFDAFEAAQRVGLDVIVLDHHIGEARKPAVVALVNPNRLDEVSEHKQLAAVGVTFLFVVAVNRALREAGYFADRPIPDPLQWLDLVALGTVCDVVPLTGFNRALVTQGLKMLAQRRNTGLRAVADLAGLNEKPGTYHLGYILGPRINAGGRVGAAELGTRLLTTEDETEAAEFARTLERHNAERKALEQLVLEQAFAVADAQLGKHAMLVVQGNGWHQGVIGIVAGRLKERYDLPVAVIAVENGIGKASARSVPGVDMGAAVNAARSAGLLLAGGGHAMAAGFTVAEPSIGPLREFLHERVEKAVAGYAAARHLTVDGFVNIGAMTVELAHLLEQAGPYGQGHPSPRFALQDVRVAKADIVGNGHVRVILVEGGVGAAAQPVRLKAIAFRAADTPLGQALLGGYGGHWHVAGQLRASSWNGQESAEFSIDDLAPAG